MNARRFNPLMSRINEIWAAEVLGLQVNESKGPDLVGKHCYIEVKFALIGERNGRSYPLSWTVFDHQLKYNENGKKLYWGLGTYSLSKPVSEITPQDLKNLEDLVLERYLWILPQNFMDQYEVHQIHGISKMTGIPWNNNLIYPKLEDIPVAQTAHVVKKGVVQIARGINEKHFDL